MAISCVPDIDGLSILGGQDAYQHYHHLLAHGLLFGIVATAVSVRMTNSRIRIGVLYFLLFHLHLLCDFFGSGPGWGIAYFWPFSARYFTCTSAWEYQSPQNFAILGILVLWSLGIAIRVRRTPLEFIAPRFDEWLLKIYR